MTNEQKQEIRRGLETVTNDRAGFVRWMIRIFKTTKVDHEVDFHYHRIGHD